MILTLDNQQPRKVMASIRHCEKIWGQAGDRAVLAEEGPKKLRALIPLHKPDTEEQATAVFWRRAQTGREAPSVVDMQKPMKEVRESL